MKLLNFLNKTIEYSFYLLFILVPLALTGDTSELFEFNKLWATFIITVIIGTAWGVKMVLRREFKIQRTPLDIPILLFLGSQILSTIFSIDVHTSLWGYYSRFNGGLLSILSYAFLFYAFVSNFADFGADEQKEKELNWNSIAFYAIGIFVFFAGNVVASLFRSTQSAIPVSMLISLASVIAAFAVFAKVAPANILKKSIYFILSGAVLVVLWGLPSHFGFDPTCLLFRGTLDVACWTNQFQPKVRIFSTLGQPDWLGAYLAVIAPIVFALFVKEFKNLKEIAKPQLVKLVSLLVFGAASYVSILWTQSRGAVLAVWVEFVIFFLYLIWFFIRPKFNLKKLGLDFKLLLSLVILLFLVTFFAGQPFSFLNVFTLNGIQAKISSMHPTKSAPAKVATPAPAGGELGGTDSGKIRLLVWEGAITIWEHYPIFGSGVETYAFSYYQYRPAAHNLTSEWNYLYNKAHNEFLNYLATTGTVGIVTYLLMLGTFLFVSGKFLLDKTKKLGKEALVGASLVAAYIGILVSNFFGFSVVIMNIFLFTIPAFFLLWAELFNEKRVLSFDFAANKKAVYNFSYAQKIISLVLLLIAAYILFVLVRFWQADRFYYLGYNYDQAGNYQNAYPYLLKAVQWRPSEPTFRDELSINEAILASAIIYQNQQKPDTQSLNTAQQLLQDSVAQVENLTQNHPNNVVFAKTKVRVFYTLSQVDSSYLPKALDAIKRASQLAPTDPDVSYNLGVLTGQSGDLKKAIQILQNTIKLKPDYQNGNAYFALGLFYHQLAIDKNGKVINQDYENKAIEEMKYVVKNYSSNQSAQDALNAWTK